MIRQECAPGLRRGFAGAHDVFADTALPDVAAKLEKFAVDAGCTTEPEPDLVGLSIEVHSPGTDDLFNLCAIDSISLTTSLRRMPSTTSETFIRFSASGSGAFAPE